MAARTPRARRRNARERNRWAERIVVKHGGALTLATAIAEAEAWAVEMCADDHDRPRDRLVRELRRDAETVGSQ